MLYFSEYINNGGGYLINAYVVEHREKNVVYLRPLNAKKLPGGDLSYEFTVSDKPLVKISLRKNGKFYRVGQSTRSSMFMQTTRPVYNNK